MKKMFLLFVCICCILTGCRSDQKKGVPAASLPIDKSENVISVKDSSNHTVTVKKSPEHVAALSSSLAELWLLSGGKLSGVSNDALEERDLGISKNDVQIIGTAMKPNLEKILNLQPDLVILSQNMSSNMELTKALDNAEIPYYICKADNLNDYLADLNNFTSITEKKDLYQQNGTDVQNRVKKLLDMLPKTNKTAPSALVLHAFSSGVKAMSDGNAVCTILDDIGAINIAQSNASLLNDLSIEAIIKDNPDYIFVVTMGKDEKAASDALKKSLALNPAWKNLQAVQKDHVYVLPKILFQYKPNNKWGDSYEYLLKITHPEIYEK